MTEKEAIAHAKRLARAHGQAYVAYTADAEDENGDWRVVSSREHLARPSGPSSVWYTVGVTGTPIFSGKPRPRTAPGAGAMSTEELRDRRSALGLTQPELADALGIHRVTVSNWERGAHPIPKWLTLALDQLRSPRPIDPATDALPTPTVILRRDGTPDRRRRPHHDGAAANSS
jgi:DNA-binding XRE family transcriptional regulator